MLHNRTSILVKFHIERSSMAVHMTRQPTSLNPNKIINNIHVNVYNLFKLSFIAISKYEQMQNSDAHQTSKYAFMYNKKNQWSNEILFRGGNFYTFNYKELLWVGFYI